MSTLEVFQWPTVNFITYSLRYLDNAGGIYYIYLYVYYTFCIYYLIYIYFILYIYILYIQVYQ